MAAPLGATWGAWGYNFGGLDVYDAPPGASLIVRWGDGTASTGTACNCGTAQFLHSWQADGFYRVYLTETAPDAITIRLTANVNSSATDNLTLIGTSATDLILGGSGNDIIKTGNGPDGMGMRFGNLADGGAGNDTIYGGNNVDALIGGDGDDLVRGYDGGDLIGGGNDNDRLYGDGGNDTLYGDNGNDKLYGGIGDDYLDGGAGTDYLYGEAGSDTFSFTPPAIPAFAALVAPPVEYDTVFDFSGVNDDNPDNDHLDLHEYNLVSNGALHFNEVTPNRFDGTGGSVRAVVSNNGNTHVQIDLDGNGRYDAGSDFQVVLKGAHTISEADLYL